MKRRIFILVAILAGLGAWGLDRAAATTLLRLSLEQLSQASSLVVRARVLDAHSEWDPSRTGVFTLTRVAVDHVMKGSPPEIVTIRQRGGAIGTLRVRVPGSAFLQPGVSYILFLEPSAENPSEYLVAGMMQGSYRVYRDPRTGEERVLRPLGSAVTAVSGAESGGSAPLQEFSEEISSALRAPIVIPSGTLLPVVVESVVFYGVGRGRVTGRITQALYPSSTTVIPAGSLVEGAAQGQGSGRSIHWISLSVRGNSVPLEAVTEHAGEGRLKGQAVVARVR